MASIMTNASAMTALRTLTATNKALDQTQSRISTGYRVAEAADNAAYWSIATTMRSDNMALSTVQDALGLGSATVDVAYTALESGKKVLDDIKAKLVAAKQPGVDRTKIQADITQLRSQLQGIASAASFSGSNWLAIDSADPSYSAVQTVVSSFSRNNDGTFTIGTVDIPVGRIALFDASATGYGLVEAGAALSNVGGLAGTVTYTAGTATTAGKAALPAFGGTAMTLDANDIITFNIAVDGGPAKAVSITRDTINSALGVNTGTVSTAANYATVINAAMVAAGVTGVSAANNGGAVEFTSATIGTTSAVAISGVKSSNNGIVFDLTSVDITAITEAQLTTYIQGVDRMAESATTAATDLGAAKKRISLQTDFVQTLMDAIERGIGQLVDADMNEESTRLQALQTQQQLGIQALSIANSNSQNVLKLFQG